MTSEPPTSALRDIAQDLTDPRRLFPALSAGLVVGLLILVLEVSLASLIFSGPLAGFASAAAGGMLFGAFLMCLIVTLGSRFTSSVCSPQDGPAPILAAVAAAIASQLAVGTDPRVGFVTVCVAIALSTLATGVLFLLMARFGLGGPLRFLPYPVVGGFIAGIGWLLIQGSYSVMTGVSLSIAELPRLLQADKLMLAAPGLVLALTLLGAMRRWKSVFILPGVLVAAFALFGAAMALSGLSRAEAERIGLLLGGGPEGGRLWPVFDSDDLARVDWSALLPQLPQLATIPLLSAISSLLMISGIEAALRRDLSLKHELTVNGLANVAAALAPANAGYTSFAFSILGPKTGSDSRLVGLTAALMVGATTFFGAALIGVVPRFLLGGMLLFLGIATLIDCVADVRRRGGRGDFALIGSILLTIALFGFLWGVVFGLVMAALIFTVQYSRLPVVTQQGDVRTLRSLRKRPPPDDLVLRDRGRSVRVMRVGGYLFFGSANDLAQTVTSALEDPQGPPSHLIIDFADVDGFDSSAVNCIVRSVQRCDAASCEVLVAGARALLEAELRRALSEEPCGVRYCADLDRALEGCEDEVIARQRAADSAAHREQLLDRSFDDLSLQLAERERFEALLEALGDRLEKRAFVGGQKIVAKGQPLDGIHFLLRGQAEEVLPEGANGPTGASAANCADPADGAEGRRLRTLGPGELFGSIAQMAALADIIALGEGAVALLSLSALREIEQTDPVTALAVVRLYAERLDSGCASRA